MATHSSILAWTLCGQRGLAGYSPWRHKKSDTTEQLSTRDITKWIYNNLHVCWTLEMPRSFCFYICANEHIH